MTLHGVKIPTRDDIDELKEMLEEMKIAQEDFKLQDVTQVDLDSAVKLISTLSMMLVDNIEKLHIIGTSGEKAKEVL